MTNSIDTAKWHYIVSLAKRGDLCLLTEDYPRESVEHFANLQAIALTCAPVPSVDREKRDLLRCGKRVVVYDAGKLEPCQMVPTKKRRIHESPLCMYDMVIFHNLLDNHQCEICATARLHTTFSFVYGTPESPTHDDHTVRSACVICTKQIVARDPDLVSRDYWLRPGDDLIERMIRYNAYRQYGILDNLGVYGDDDEKL